MKINLISYEPVHDWILGKFALQLESHLQSGGFVVQISDKPIPGFDIYHHIHYEFFNPSEMVPGIHTLMITHIDSKRKFELIHRQIQAGAIGICMSSDTMNSLLNDGISPSSLTYINPAHDGIIKRRKVNIGITTRLYADGRKREYLISELLRTIDPSCFRFTIMGAGWDSLMKEFHKHEVEVNWYPTFNLEIYSKIIPEFDYYLYTGLDEGQIGVIDCVASGIPVITTPQGFHLDINRAIPYFFNSAEDLGNIFSNIQNILTDRIKSVENWTWSEYSLKHLELWAYLCAEQLEIKHKSERADGLPVLLNKLPLKPCADNIIGKLTNWSKMFDYYTNHRKRRWLKPFSSAFQKVLWKIRQK